jgi:primary-amine oxidase
VAGVQIVAVSLAVRHHLAAHTSIKAIRFLTNYLLPPPKRAVLAHLRIPLATGETVKDEDRVPIVRKAEVDVSRAYYNSLFRCLRESCYMYGTPKAGFGPTY